MPLPVSSTANISQLNDLVNPVQDSLYDAIITEIEEEVMRQIETESLLSSLQQSAPLQTSQAAFNLVPDDIEYAALRDLFESTNGQNWTDNSGWDYPSWKDPATVTFADFNDWFGVFIMNGDVVSIEMEGNNLTGTLTESIGQLIELTQLKLGINYSTATVNQIGGVLPASLGNLNKLLSLDLSRNQIGGSIPTSFGNLTSIEEINLELNEITGNIPIEMAALANLDELDLGANNLSGSIPTFLGSLNLVRLALFDNNFSGQIPAELANLTSLKVLHLSDNQLSGNIPEEIGNMTNLKQLILSRNMLAGSLPNSIGNLSNLTSLYLNNNSLSGAIPSTIGNLNALVALSFAYNNIDSSIPSELGGLENLRNLDLRDNQLSGPIPVELGGLSNLYTLDLRNNLLTGQIPLAISGLSSLTTFTLTNNQISGSIPASIGGLTNLVFVDFSENQLSGTLPVELGDLVNLQSLSILNNRLTGSIPSSIGNILGLTSLSLAGNELSGSIPNSFENLTNLNFLNLRDNQITGDITPLNDLSNLSIIDLSENNFTGSIAGLLDMPEVTLLLYRNNFSGYLPPRPNPSYTLLIYENNFVFGDLEDFIYQDIGLVGLSPQNSILGQAATLNFIPGQPFTIPFTTSGNNNLYQWQKFNGVDWDNVGIKSSDNDLFLVSTTESTAGIYRVEVTNTIVVGLTLYGHAITLVPDINNTCFVNSLCFRFGDPITEITIPEGFEDYVFEATPFTCEELNTQEIVRTLDFQQNEYISGKVEDFRDDYYAQCADATQVNDDFEVSYDLGYHHYTLYYYDRAGNLMRTVPPLGFNTTDPNDHQMATDYHYNSLGQLVKQNSPDGGETYFYYNDLGQLRFSQNAQQDLEGAYSYTKYDNLGRIVEVGESTNGLSTFKSLTNSPDFPQEGTEKTVTIYTEAYAGALTSPQRFLQNRVSYTYLDEDGLDGTLDDRTYTIYSYDPHGNVEWLVQRVPGLEDKVIQYNYDLISGNVLMVSYNPGYADQFYHKYDYDEDNRITSVSTSVDGKVWDIDATYEYYPHGPLKTANIGEDNLQQLDYIYTIHGWLKALNNPDANDGTNTFGKDAFAMAINYYNGDYTNPNTNVGLLTAATGRELFNGNISAWELATHASDDQWVRTGYQYQYDELNRIKDSRFNVYRAAAPSTPTFYARGGFHADFNLDANGNLQNLNRNDVDAVNFDALTYNYDLSLSNNRLKGVTDAVLDTEVHPQDLESQPVNNYTYDEIGNLTRDDQEDIDIGWTVYGKVDALTKGGGGGTKFTYDAAGNRVKKQTVDVFGNVYSTYYVRDASGNIMGTYRANSGAPELREVPIYGSDRIGVYTPEGAETNNQEAVENIAADGTVNSYDGVSYELEDGVSLTLQPGFKFEDGADGNNFSVASASATSGALPADVYARTLDQKQYELKDHLGNVRAVITDRKQSETESGTPQNFTPKIVSASAYYPYGMDMPTVRWQEFTSTATMEPADILLELPEFDNYAEIAGNPEITISDPVFNHTETYVNQGPTDVPSYSFRLTGETGKIIGLSKSLKVQAGDKITASVFGKYLMPDGSEDPTDIATSLADAFLTTFGITSTQEVATINQFFTDLLGGTLTLTKPDDPSGNNVIAGINCVVFDEDFNFVDAGFQLFTAAAVNDHEELALPEYIVPKDGYVFIYTSNESPQVTQVNFDDLVVTHEKLVPDEAYDSDLIAYRYGFNGKEKDQKGEWGGSIGTSGELVASLVVDLPFDGNANDVSGNELNGTVNGATLTLDRDGNANSAYAFDGVSDYIELTGSEDDLAFIHNTGVFSISTWVKLEDLSILQYIVSNSTFGTNPGFALLMDPTNGQKLVFLLITDGSTNSGVLGNVATIDDTQWHHIAVVGNGSNLQVYVDGITDGESGDIIGLIDGNSSGPGLIGGINLNGTYSYHLNGSVDQLQIYNRALTPTEIVALSSDQTPEEIDASSAGSASLGLAHYDYGFRIYNPAIGKFLSVDPLTRTYPMLTPYQFASNTPIYAVDVDGLEAAPAELYQIDKYLGRKGIQVDALSIDELNYERRRAVMRVYDIKRVEPKGPGLALLPEYKFDIEGAIEKKRSNPEYDLNRAKTAAQIMIRDRNEIFDNFVSYNARQNSHYYQAKRNQASRRAAAAREAFLKSQEITSSDVFNAAFNTVGLGVGIVASTTLVGTAATLATADQTQASWRILIDKYNMEYDPDKVYTIGGIIEEAVFGEAVYYEYVATGASLVGGGQGLINVYSKSNKVLDSADAITNLISAGKSTVEFVDKED
ncbi:MAG: LamG-like jellyroll fold domain-containing protein [Fulvivirga sp.]